MLIVSTASMMHWVTENKYITNLTELLPFATEGLLCPWATLTDTYLYSDGHIHQLLPSTPNSRHDSNWHVHSLMLSHHDLHGLPL